MLGEEANVVPTRSATVVEDLDNMMYVLRCEEVKKWRSGRSRWSREEARGPGQPTLN